MGSGVHTVGSSVLFRVPRTPGPAAHGLAARAAGIREIRPQPLRARRREFLRSSARDRLSARSLAAPVSSAPR
jgi:hypothetical protein